jgi:hypothetical protein
MSFITYTLYQILFGSSNQGGYDWVRHVARMGEMRNAYNILIGNPEYKKPLGRLKRTWEDKT